MPPDWSCFRKVPCSHDGCSRLSPIAAVMPYWRMSSIWSVRCSSKLRKWTLSQRQSVWVLPSWSASTGKFLSEATFHWQVADIDKCLRAATELPVHIEADVRAAARCEAHFGAGRPFRSFLYVTVGTGISASLVVNRVPYAGARGLTGTFASSRGLIPGNDGSLVSGLPLEQFASGPAMAARLAMARPSFAGTARDVLSLAETEDSLALAIVTSSGEALGAAIGQLINLLDPEAVIIGGGLGLATGHYRLSLEAAMRTYIWSDLHRDIPLLSAEMGNDAGFIGAALAASCQ